MHYCGTQWSQHECAAIMDVIMDTLVCHIQLRHAQCIVTCTVSTANAECHNVC